MNKWTAALILLFAVISVGGCAGGAETDTDIERKELIVSAAASLTDSMEELRRLYETAHPHIHIIFNFGSSGALKQQMIHGAPADLFLSASTSHMEDLSQRNLIAESVNLLWNELVVITPASSDAAITQLDELTAEHIGQVAMGVPETVPAGTYAKEALTYYKLWDALQPKLIFTKDVRQVLTYVETGNVDAGFVYRTDASTSAHVQIAMLLESHSHEPITYPAGLLKGTEHEEEARQFLQFLQSDVAKRVFEKYGFKTEPS